ncbi:MAG: phosphate acyltransferase PlsX, partial [Planctomycetota bacterium]
MRIAVDVMGGDNAPDAIVLGCLGALEQLGPDDTLIMVGCAATCKEIMDERRVDDPRVVIEHAPDQIGMDESPVEAVRTKPDSSLVRLATLGSTKKSKEPADVVISAGNTGACVSAATMYMRRLPGVHRPGIGCVIPSFHGPVTVCDVGANPEPRASHLAQYGVMAEQYASKVLHIDNPRVAIMNIGSEEAKGTGMIKQVRAALAETPRMNFIGYIEGRDLFEGAADVVITDGFVGNTTLKLAEGMAKSLFKGIAQAVTEADMDLAMQLQPILGGLIKKNDYHEYGGAPLLGVNGVCMICHGSSQARTITNAIRNSMEYVTAGVNDAIVARLAELDEYSEA